MATTNEKGPAACNDRAHENTTNESHDSTGVVQPAQESAAKSLATLRAQAALRGFELLLLADGTFLVARWGRTRTFATLASAEAGLAQMGVGS